MSSFSYWNYVFWGASALLLISVALVVFFVCHGNTKSQKETHREKLLQSTLTEKLWKIDPKGHRADRRTDMEHTEPARLRAGTQREYLVTPS